MDRLDDIVGIGRQEGIEIVCCQAVFHLPNALPLRNVNARKEHQGPAFVMRKPGVNRLRQWAADERSPVDFEFERKEGTISIRGYKEFNGMPIPEELRTSNLPSIDAPVVDARRQ